MRTEQEEFWRGDFGRSYSIRNRPDWRSRVEFWADIIKATGVRSILEVGANIGTNLKAIRHVDPTIATWGCDVNVEAITEAADAGLSVSVCSVYDLDKEYIGHFDMVATVGMLIHVAPGDLSRAMDCIIAASKRYVLAVEYADEQEVEVPYRGHSEKLWRRPFGDLYRAKGLKVVAGGEAPSPAFDRCHFWLMERQ